MKSTFARAFVGFVTLIGALALGCMVALWALEKYAGGVWWASLLVVLIGLVMSISIYASTLHLPVQNWINEPRLERERLAREKKDAARDARAGADNPRSYG